MRLLGRFAAICVLTAIVASLGSPDVQAESVRLGTLPTKPGALGFLMTAEMEVVAGNGYQPIYITFSPFGKAFKRDRRLSLQLEPRHDRKSDLDFAFSESMMVDEGTSSFSTTIYVPHYYPWESVKISLFEDGRPIEHGSRTFHLVNGLRTRFADQTSTVGIIIPSDVATQDAAWKVCPDVRTLVTVLGDGPIPEDVIDKRLPHALARKRVDEVQPAWVQFRPLEELKLHDDWLGYSQLDIILASQPVLERIEQQQPERFEQLVTWLSAGGNLWVYAAGTPSADTFLSRLRTDPANPNVFIAPAGVPGKLQLKSLNDTSELVNQSWGGAQKESTHYSYRSSKGKKEMLIRGDAFKKLKSRNHSFAQTASKQQLARGVRFGSYGVGRVLAISEDDPFPGSFQFWRSVVDLHTDGQVVWTERMGIDVPRGNDNYWMWLIPSVGEPPVKSFVFLNTLFVILIGPICYVFFRKRQRLYLLYFFAPGLAVLVTISLFVYAIGADGTQTKMRSRQLTWLDIEHEVAVGQSRQTYYAVFGSGKGVGFPVDAAVYPVRNAPVISRYYRHNNSAGPQGKITVDETSQRFSGTFFPPRNQVQYLITRPQSMPRTLEFSQTKGTPSVTNDLPYDLKRLVMCDANGKLWSGDDLSTGSSVDLAPAATSILAEILGADVIPPLGSVPMLQKNNRRYGPGTGLQVSLLENRLQQWSLRMPPKTIIAIADLADDRLGVDDAIVLDSTHVIMGRIP